MLMMIKSGLFLDKKVGPELKLFFEKTLTICPKHKDTRGHGKLRLSG